MSNKDGESIDLVFFIIILIATIGLKQHQYHDARVSTLWGFLVAAGILIYFVGKGQ